MCYKYVNILSDKQNVLIISLIPFYVTFFFIYFATQTRQGSPVDSRPSTAKAQTVGKIHPFRKIAVTFKPVMRFGGPSRFRIS